MQIEIPAPWPTTTAAARDLQTELAAKVVQTPLTASPSTILGLDVSFPTRSTALAAGVLLSFPELEVLEQVEGQTAVPFPYIPGLLSFREIPALLQAMQQLKTRPDLIFCDGQGLAHPRRFGLACHLGVIVDIPTIGCAKSRFIGVYDEPDNERGSRADLMQGDEQIGVVLRTRTRVKPIFVSVGHRIMLDEAVTLALQCAPKYRIPQPTRLADQAAAGKQFL